MFELAVEVLDSQICQKKSMGFPKSVFLALFGHNIIYN